jgi:hypothetical protein
MANLRQAVAIIVAFSFCGCRCGLLAPRYPVLGVEVRRAASGYEVLFENCTNDAVIEIYYVKVLPSVELNRVDETPPLCFIEIDSSAPHQKPIVGKWSYGSLPTGYAEKTRCEPLDAGREYRILTWHQGSGRFAVQPDGSIRMLEGGCRK